MDELVGADDELADVVVLLELGVHGVVVDLQLPVLRQRRRAHVAVLAHAVHAEAEVEVRVGTVEGVRLEGASPAPRLPRRGRRRAADHPDAVRQLRDGELQFRGGLFRVVLCMIIRCTDIERWFHAGVWSVRGFPLGVYCNR